jgi:hypothetical protein
MYRKKFSRSLFLILLALLAIVLTLEMWGDEGRERSFDRTLLNADTTLLDRIEVSASSPDSRKSVLRKEGRQWLVSDDSRSYQTDEAFLARALEQLSTLESERIVAMDPEKWDQYQVDDTNGVKLSLYQQGELLGSLILGNFTFDQQSRTPYSYIRLEGRDEVHKVEGMYKMLFSPDISTYRDKRILDLAAGDLRQIHFRGDEHYPSWTLQKMEEGWAYNGMPADSMKVADYLNQISSLRSTHFVNAPEDEPGVASYSLKLEGENMSAAQLDIFTPDSLTRLLRSSQHPDGLWDASTDGLWDKILFDLEEE